MPDSTLSTLAQIQIKVRRLTRTLSTNQLSDADLNNYINTFVLYDFPESLRLFDLRGNFTFYTIPNQDTYGTLPIVPGEVNPLANFINTIISIHEPVFCNGYPLLYTQSESQFYSLYPPVNLNMQFATGDGVTYVFNGNFNNYAPFLPGTILIATVDDNGNPLQISDGPPLIGQPNEADLFAAVGPLSIVPYGSINYLTGAFTVDFTNFGAPPGNGQKIWFNGLPYVADRPNTILFYNSVFKVRPVPDQSYPIKLEAYVRPDELLATNQQPKLSQWWQYIAYGAAKKIFEDRMDLDSVQMIMPEFMNQESMVLRRTLLEFTNERTATVYTEQTADGVYGNGYGWNNS
jgi:hypothetical protein